ncbi:hypothetical protein JB92DRAFT_2838175 [Gautieria morchelliformis]|nr:hypothetical protein JB92DRAFT_2838175 [Gautieria morchelliformis]
MPSSSRPRRVYRREWKLQTRSVRGSVSLPRLHLMSPSRPLFECPTCYSCNDRLPVCLWCKSTSRESATAFWASMPKQRTVSAPKQITWSCVPLTATTAVPIRTASAEGVSRPRSRTTPSTPSASSHSSYVGNKSNVLLSSIRTSTTTTTEAMTAMTSPTSPQVDEMRHVPPVNSDQKTSQPEEGHFHTLPLRRRGNILRTTAGMVVNKSRLSALFRKDAVPVLDKHVPAPAPPPAKTRRMDKLRTSTNFNHGGSRAPRQKRSTLTAPPPSLPTIPDASVPAPTPHVASVYTTPTPPSFLSPFWYRPEEYNRLPSSPSPSRSASVKTTGPVKARPRHVHTRSEPFPIPEREPGAVSDAIPNAWKRMSGFFRHSISVVIAINTLAYLKLIV